MPRLSARSLSALAAAFTLAACGGGGGSITRLGPPTASSFVALTSDQRLVGFEGATPGSLSGSVRLSGLAMGESVLGLSFRPSDGLLYALISSPAGARVATIDLATGAVAAGVALVSDPASTTAFTALSGTRYGLDFNPVPDRLRVVSDSGQNLRINVATGATIVDGALNGAAATASAAAYTNAFAAACRSSLYVIDPASDRVYLQNPPNNGYLQAVGGLGLDVTAVLGFDIRTEASGTNTAFAVLSSAAGTTLNTIDLATGAAGPGLTFRLAPGETISNVAVRALAAGSTPAQAPGELIGLADDGISLVSFQRGSPGKLCTSGTVTGLPDSTTLLGLATRPSTGTLVGVATNGKLYGLTNAGAATELCTLAADPADLTAPFTTLDPTPGVRHAIGFNPVPDRLRVVSSTGSNLRINPNASAGSCLVTTDTDLSGGTPSVTAVGYTNTVPAAGSTALYGVDTSGDALIRIGNDPANGTAGDPGNPNSGVVTSIGSLGLAGDVGANAGFVIDGRTNQAYAALQAAPATGSTLYTVNLGSGAATAVGAVGGGTSLRALALTGGTALRLFALTSDGHLLSATQSGNVLAPVDVTDLTIGGLSGGDTLLGIALRPATGKLYGLGSGGRLYTISPMTGAATLVATLVADPADTTAPFAGLTSGAITGMDFNPTVDRLRVVDATGSNLRINVDTGRVTTDDNLSSTGVLAAAYSNSFVGTTATTLFDLDATTLFQQTPPNAGTLVTVGATGQTALGTVGFDIAGGANGLALVALRTAAGSGPSTLYRVNLATGALTLSNGASSTIGTSGTAQVVGLAIELR